MREQATDRLVEFAFKLSDGELDEVQRWLESLGCTEVVRDEGQITVTGTTGMRVGLVASDPNTCAVQLGFAVAGPYWPFAFPDLHKKVNVLWKARVKAAKEKKLLAKEEHNARN